MNILLIWLAVGFFATLVCSVVNYTVAKRRKLKIPKFSTEHLHTYLLVIMLGPIGAMTMIYTTVRFLQGYAPACRPKR